MTSRRAWVAPAVALLAVLAMLGLFGGDPGLDLGATSFGTVPAGQRAALELLARIAPPVSRSFAPPEALPADASVLYVDPWVRLCSPAAAAPAGGDASPTEPPAERDRDAAPLLAWVETGGTALILLGVDGPCAGDARLGDLVLPGRLLGALPPPRDTALLGAVVSGDLVPAPRGLGLRDLVTFQGAGVEEAGWAVVASADGRPFVVERAIGRGRLALAADHRFVTNAELDQADAAPLLFDLVRRYRIDRIDERAHGMRRVRSASAYLARSTAVPFFVAIALLGAVLAWGGAALPVRRLADDDPEAPTLERFVASLAALYRATRDHARALERTRELTASRLRRHFGLAPETPLGLLVERLRKLPRATPEAIDVLASAPPARSRDELERAARLLERLVQEVRR